MLPPPFENQREFRAAFIRGLGHILAQESLGAFILVLANAAFDREIYQLLKSRLEMRFSEWSHLSPEKLQVAGSADDIVVFRRLQQLGFDNLQLTEFRRAGPWELQFNQLRSFRPARMTSEKMVPLRLAFNPDGFHFNRDFLQPEIFWRGDLLGRDSRLLYNKFPFAELHGLLVVDAAQNKPQFLNPIDHSYIWALIAELGEALPGAGFGYNACGAFASVNHLHFQMYVRESSQYPVEAKAWRHNGGEMDYPLACHAVTDVDQAWKRIDELHQSGDSYNLLYRPGLMYLLPRAAQGSYQHVNWTHGFAWAETAGSITTFRQQDFARLTEPAIRGEYARMRT